MMLLCVFLCVGEQMEEQMEEDEIFHKKEIDHC